MHTLPSLLFNIYVEKIFQLALKDYITGIKVNGILINNLQYADNTTILAENIQKLQIKYHQRDRKRIWS